MKIDEQQRGAVSVIKTHGPLVEADCDEVRDLLLKTAKENFGRIVLDVSEVPFMDSQGLETLVDVTDEMARSGQTLRLCGVNQTVREVFELTGISSQFEHFEDLNSAVRSFL